MCPLSLWQGGSSSAEIQSEPDRLQGAKEHELVRALVSTLPADYCTVIAPEERRAHAQMLHELRESSKDDPDRAKARWYLSSGQQARFHIVHRNRCGIRASPRNPVRTAASLFWPSQGGLPY